MAGFSINFFATDEEIAQWLQEWLGLETVMLVALTFRPFSSKKVAPCEVPDVLSNRDVWRFILFASSPILDATNQGEFDDKNSDGLILDVGHLSEQGLKESGLSCLTDDKDILAKWRRIAKHLRSKTLAGVTAINRQSGESGYYRSDRYSRGAKELEDAGIPILPIQGINGPIIRLGKVLE